MASQVTSGYSTEGTQYAQNNSFYLLDTVPGSGFALQGPVTISGNLSVTGTTTLLGAAGALSLNTNTITAGPASATYAASGNLAVSSATQLTLQGASVGVTATAGALNLVSSGAGSVVMSPAAGGSVVVASTGSAAVTAVGALTVNAASLTETITGTALITGGAAAASLTLSSASSALVNGTKSLSVSSDAAEASVGWGMAVNNTSLYLDRGIALGVNQGSFFAAAVATQSGGLATFTMTGNKAVIITPPACSQLTVNFPNPLGGIQWMAVYGKVGVNPTNIDDATVIQQATFIRFPAAGGSNQITVWVYIV